MAVEKNGKCTEFSTKECFDVFSVFQVGKDSLMAQAGPSTWWKEIGLLSQSNTSIPALLLTDNENLSNFLSLHKPQFPQLKMVHIAVTALMRRCRYNI